MGDGSWSAPPPVGEGGGFVLPKEIADRMKDMVQRHVDSVAGKVVIIEMGGTMQASVKARELANEVERLEGQLGAMASDLAKERQLSRGERSALEEIATVIRADATVPLVESVKQLKDKLREYADEIDRLEDAVEEAVKSSRRPVASVKARVVSVVEDTKTLYGANQIEGHHYERRVSLQLAGSRSVIPQLIVLDLSASDASFEVGREVTLEIVP